MLILSRHENELIRIGRDVVIAVVAIRGDRVQLGISAPDGVPVHRQEVYERIHRGPGLPPGVRNK
jgi:carbon storage regulator